MERDATGDFMARSPAECKLVEETLSYAGIYAWNRNMHRLTPFEAIRVTEFSGVQPAVMAISYLAIDAFYNDVQRAQDLCREGLARELGQPADLLARCLPSRLGINWRLQRAEQTFARQSPQLNRLVGMRQVQRILETQYPYELGKA